MFNPAARPEAEGTAHELQRPGEPVLPRLPSGRLPREFDALRASPTDREWGPSNLLVPRR